MTIKDAIPQRHMVRKYLSKPILAETVTLLNTRIADHNARYGLNLKLVTGNSDGIGGMAKLLLTKSVYNYIVLAGQDCVDLDEKLGYCGADLILYAQTLGLNTWWCGGMFNGKGALKHLESANVCVNGVIAIGYGQTQGVPHKSKTSDEISKYDGKTPQLGIRAQSKTSDEISKYDGETPQWFKDGVEALLCAPTALNKQPYMVTGRGNNVTITAGNGHFSGIDLGIGKYFFEVGAGKDNFEWTL